MGETAIFVYNKIKNMKIDLIIFSSPLHSQESIIDTRKPLFSALEMAGELKITEPENFENSSNSDDRMVICFIATGGTEEQFLKVAHKLPSPVLILSDGYHNSLAASFEIVTWLKKRDLRHKFINVPLSFENLDIVSEFDNAAEYCSEVKSQDTMSTDLQSIYDNPAVQDTLYKSRVGLIGGASSWLISSGIDKDYVTDKHGVTFIDIDIKEVIHNYNSLLDSDIPDYGITANSKDPEVRKALKMTKVLENICTKYSLTALTIKCFDLLNSSKTTSCLALGILNDRGIVSGCEGDIPALWTMIIGKALHNSSTFMSNPSSASKKELSIDFAHCTIPLSLVKSYTLPTHFESNIGIGVAGLLPICEYSVMKIGGERLDQLYKIDGFICENTNILQRCRTQIKFKFSSQSDYNAFFANRLGNHVVIIPRKGN